MLYCRPVQSVHLSRVPGRVQLWAIGRLNVPLTQQDRATILSFCKQSYPSGSATTSSLKATTHSSAPPLSSLLLLIVSFLGLECPTHR